MPSKKKNAVDSLYDLLKMNPKQAIIILIIAGIAYLFGGDSVLDFSGNDGGGGQDFVQGVIVRAVDGGVLTRLKLCTPTSLCSFTGRRPAITRRKISTASVCGWSMTLIRRTGTAGILRTYG